MRFHAACSCLLAVSIAALTAAAPIAGFPPKLQPADLVLRDGAIATLDPLQPQVQAIAIHDGRIEAIGSNAEIVRYIGAKTQTLDLHGAFVTPGFMEGHGHLIGTGSSLMELDLGKASNWDAIVAMVKDAVAKAKPGEWIVGAGWHEGKWKPAPQPNVEGLPLPASLNAVSPNNPVMLDHVSGHGTYANALALELAGITRDTPDPPGGTIVRDKQGNPIGMLRDTAADPVVAAYRRYLAKLPPQEVERRRERALQLALQNEVSKGITGFVDMGEDFKTLEWVKRQADNGFPLRLYVNVAGESVDALDRQLAQHRNAGYADDHFTVLGIGEVLSDGALGTRSALMLHPYSDTPNITGKNVVPMADIERMGRIAARDGMQLSVHAIGDRANREVLDLFQRIFEQDPAAHALRWRIEHAQHLDPVDVPRFAQLGVIASMQSIHACSDAPVVVPRLGEQRAKQGAYVWHSLIESGAMVLDGSDTPVEDTNPIAGFYCAVTRREGNGKLFFPEQVKTREEALRDYTWNNAYAVYEDKDLGSLTVGKRADMDVFSGNLLTIPAADILRTRVLYTIVGGKVVYKKDGAENWRSGQWFEPMPEFDHVD